MRLRQKSDFLIRITCSFDQFLTWCLSLYKSKKALLELCSFVCCAEIIPYGASVSYFLLFSSPGPWHTLCKGYTTCVLDARQMNILVFLVVFGSSLLPKAVNGVQRSAIAVPDPSIMACLNNPCMNNGFCHPDPSSDKGFKCACVPEYKGILCEGWWNTLSDNHAKLVFNGRLILNSYSRSL